MSFKLPRSKSSATRTAKALRAIAHDLRNAADGFEHAAADYQAGDPVIYPDSMKQAFHGAEGSFNLARKALFVWKLNH